MARSGIESLTPVRVVRKVCPSCLGKECWVPGGSQDGITLRVNEEENALWSEGY